MATLTITQERDDHLKYEFIEGFIDSKNEYQLFERMFDQLFFTMIVFLLISAFGRSWATLSFF